MKQLCFRLQVGCTWLQNKDFSTCFHILFGPEATRGMPLLQWMADVQEAKTNDISTLKISAHIMSSATWLTRRSHMAKLSINEIKCILQEVRDLRTWEQLSNYSCFVYMVLHHLGCLVESNRTYFDYQKQRKNLLELCGIVHRTKRKSEKIKLQKDRNQRNCKEIKWQKLVVSLIGTLPPKQVSTYRFSFLHHYSLNSNSQMKENN